VNWLAWDTRSYLGAALGGVVGFFLFRAGLGADWFAPWLIGVGIGLGCALITRERSGLRGVVLACIAAWAAALAQVVLVSGGGLWEGIVGFHATLDLPTFLAHLGGIVGAFVFGRTSFRGDAQDRVAGSGSREFGV